MLEALLFQSHIRHAIGLDTGLGLQYRPLLNDNIVLTGGFGVLAPGAGFNDIYSGASLFSGLPQREDGVLMRALVACSRSSAVRRGPSAADG